MPIGPLPYGTHHMIQKPLSLKKPYNMQKSLFFSKGYGIDRSHLKIQLN